MFFFTGLLLLLGIATLSHAQTAVLKKLHRCMDYKPAGPHWDLRPNATSCEDDPLVGTAECQKFFHRQTKPVPAAGTTDAIRDPACDGIHWQNEALWCAKTCGLCCDLPKYNCSDTYSSPTQCSDLAAMTEDQRTKKCSEYAALNQCLSTCGLCEAHASFNCKDKHPGCILLQALCNEEKHKLRMDKLCAKTCSEAIPGNQACIKQKDHYTWRRDKVKKEEGCKDESPGCPQNVMLCENEFYESAMKDNCPKTCGYCKPTNWKCADKKGSPCEKWTKHNFCYNEDYPKGIILDYCPAKCNLCEPDSSESKEKGKGKKGKKGKGKDGDDGEEDDEEDEEEGGAKPRGGAKRGTMKKGKAAPKKAAAKTRKRT